MTLTFSSLEEAWGGKTQIAESTTKFPTLPGIQNVFSNVSNKTASSVHSTTFKNSGQLKNPSQQYKHRWGSASSSTNQKYQNVYCDEIINHVQGCSYCQQRLQSILYTPGSFFQQTHQVPQSQQNENKTLSPKVLERKHDNLAYVPFGLDPEVFNILLFSMILIALIFLIDNKKGSKSFRF